MIPPRLDTIAALGGSRARVTPLLHVGVELCTGQSISWPDGLQSGQSDGVRKVQIA